MSELTKDERLIDYFYAIKTYLNDSMGGKRVPYPTLLTWRTGPVPDRGIKYLTKESRIPVGWIQVKTGWAVYESDSWLPLSEILELIGGE